MSAVRHTDACIDGITSDGKCEPLPGCYSPYCVTCGDGVPEFPAFHVTWPGAVSGPYCDQHAEVSQNDQQGSVISDQAERPVTPPVPPASTPYRPRRNDG